MSLAAAQIRAPAAGVRRIGRAWSEASTELRRLAVMAVVDATGTGLFLAGSIVIFTRLVGISGQQVGLALTLAGVLSLATSMPLGKLVDRFGPRVVLAVVSLWRACGLLAYCWCHSFASFLAVTGFLAVADRAAPPVMQALVTTVVGQEDRVQVMAGLRALRNVGFTIGALLAAIALALNSRPGYEGILAGDAASFVLVVLLLATFPSRRRALPRHRKADEKAHESRPSRSSPPGRHRVAPAPSQPGVLQDLPFLRATLLNAILSLHMTMLAVGIPIWVIERTTAPRIILSPLLALNTILAVAFQVRASRGTSTAAGSSLALLRAGLGLAAACVLLALAPGLPVGPAVVVLAAAMVALTGAELWQSAGGWGVSYALAPPQRQGMYLSTFNMGVTAQQVFGPGLVAAVVIPAGPWGWLGLAGALVVTAAVVPRVVARAALAFLPGLTQDVQPWPGNPGNKTLAVSRAVALTPSGLVGTLRSGELYVSRRGVYRRTRGTNRQISDDRQ
jgi:MFS family permease